MWRHARSSARARPRRARQPPGVGRRDSPLRTRARSRRHLRRRRPGAARGDPLRDRPRLPRHRRIAEAARERSARRGDPRSQAGDAARLAEAGIAYQGELGMWASPSDSVGADIMREGLAALGTERPDVRARALSALAHGLVLTPGGVALPEADVAVAAADQAGDEQALCHALLVRAWAVRGVLPVRGAEGRRRARRSQRPAPPTTASTRCRPSTCSATRCSTNASSMVRRLGSSRRPTSEVRSRAGPSPTSVPRLALARGHFAEANELSDHSSNSAVRSATRTTGSTRCSGGPQPA